MTVPRIARRFLRLAPVWVAGALAILLAVEVAYRTSLFDPYRAELDAYNPPERLASGSRMPTVLCMGDSLTAGLRGWPARLQQRRADLRVINSGIPGSGIVQAELIAPRRFEAFDPAIFIYQINVTNDLLNLRFPLNWAESSPTRNIYWSVSRRLRSLEFLNYRAGQLAFALRNRSAAEGAAPPGPICDWPVEQFSPEMYTGRVRAYIEAEPDMVENQIRPRGARATDYRELLGRLESLILHCPAEKCRSYVMVIPHAVQVEPGLISNFEELGARFETDDLLYSESYPFLDGIRSLVAASPGTRLIDPLDALRRRVREGGHVYFRDDPHLNDCGQEVLAEVVASLLGPVASRTSAEARFD